MNRQFPLSRTRAFKNGVLAALEICAERRAEDSGFDGNPCHSYGKRWVVDRAAALIEPGSAPPIFQRSKRSAPAKCWRST